MTTNGIGESRSAWLRTADAAVYVGRSLPGFRAWAKRRGLVAVDGCYARRDLDKARAVPRKRHVMSPISLANLRKHAGQFQAGEAQGVAQAVHVSGGDLEAFGDVHASASHVAAGGSTYGA